MAVKETLEINKTQGDEEQIPCVNCNGKTHHKVLLSADVSGADYNGDSIEYDWNVHHQIVQCQGCKEISFRRAATNSEDIEYITPAEGRYIVHEALYPPRIEGRNGLGNAIYLLPYRVRGIYAETLQALNSNSPILAGIGLRALVETVCKEKNAQGAKLYQQIEDLKAKGILTPTGAQILHKIRTLGNDAAHEVEAHGEKQLAVAMDVVEHLLKDVYILPKQFESEFKAAEFEKKRRAALAANIGDDD